MYLSAEQVDHVSAHALQVNTIRVLHVQCAMQDAHYAMEVHQLVAVQRQSRHCVLRVKAMEQTVGTK